jgi:thioredoxin reductase (NADPH)
MQMSLIETRRDQMFPVLDVAQIETARRFASDGPRSFAPGEIVYDVGERSTPAWLVLEGSIEVVARDGLDHEVAITTHRSGQISGEVSQLAGRAALATGRAGPEGCQALPFDAVHLRALVVGSAELGEVIMRAFILRRVGLIQEGGVGSVLVGRPGAPDLVRLQGFLARNGYPPHRAGRFGRRRRTRGPGALRRPAGRTAVDDLRQRHGAEATDGR